MRQEPEKQKQRLQSLPETSMKITCHEDRPEKNLWNWQVGKIHPPAGQLVHNTPGPDLCDSDDTKRGKVSRNGVRSKQKAENSGGRDQE